MNMPQFDTEAGSFEWTPEGRQLLSNVKALIQHNGGRHLMYCKVRREANKRIYSFKQSEEPIPISENSIIFNNWHKLTIPEISKLVNLPVGTVYWRGRWLGLPPKGDKLNNKNRIITFNTETGIFYNTIKEASESTNICYHGLSKKLLGQLKNNTSFIRV